MRVTIGVKIFGIAAGLLILMAVVALLSMRMTRTVDDQLVIIDHNYFPAYVALAQANIHSVEESAYAGRLPCSASILSSSRASAMLLSKSRGAAIMFVDVLARLGDLFVARVAGVRDPLP